MLRIKANYQKQNAGKESMKITIHCLFKMNAAVTYEMDYYIFDQGIIFILSRAENVQNRNF